MELQHLHYHDPYPNVTLDSEFDLTEEIYATHQQYNIAPTFKHVKGHQHNSTAFKNLSLSAQLNVEADHLASSFYCEGPLSTDNIIMTPSC